MSDKIILVVPCYNEEKRLKPEVFMESLEKNSQLHWLFVNDGSKDKTANIIEKMTEQKPYRIFFHSTTINNGKGKRYARVCLKLLNIKPPSQVILMPILPHP